MAGTLGALLAASAVGTGCVLAQDKDWGEYTIENDGYGYLTANFPAEYTSEYITIENEVSITEKVEALLLTMTEEEKQELLEAEGYWGGISRLGIPEVVFYGEDGEAPSPGMASVRASYSETAAKSYGVAAAADVKASGANAVSSGVSEADTDIFTETAETAALEAMTSGGVITGLSWKFCDQDPAEMTQEEIDGAVSDILFAVGKAGYLGMVNVSRDGLAAEDTDAPEVIRLALDAETQEAAKAEAAEEGAVLLKNEAALPLSEAPELEPEAGDTMLAAKAEEAVVLYVAAEEMLSEEQQSFLTEQIAEAKDGGLKAVLVLATAEGVDIDEWADDCDAVLEVWQNTEQAGSVVSALLTGEISPSGHLSEAWPTQSRTEWTAGFGLSYTEFSYELVSVENAAADGEDYGLDVTVAVTNTGDAAGADVVQLYLEREDGIYPAAAQKTAVLEAGGSEELTIHVSQRGLGTQQDGEWSVQEGSAVLCVAQDSGDTTLSQEIEIGAARAGVGVTAEAPAEAAAGEPFDVTVSTPTDVISLQLTDADGSAYEPVDVLKSNLGDSIAFTYTLQISEAGTAAIRIYTVTADGRGEEPEAELSVEVK